MSIGIGGKAELITYDDTDVIYAYSVYNLNEAKRKDVISVLDGEIHLKRSCFVEPEIHQNVVRKPSGRKVTVEKRIINVPEYDKMIIDGEIIVKNASHCFKTNDEGIDTIALRLLHILFREYQRTGEFPEQISCHV